MAKRVAVWLGLVAAVAAFAVANGWSAYRVARSAATNTVADGAERDLAPDHLVTSVLIRESVRVVPVGVMAVALLYPALWWVAGVLGSQPGVAEVLVAAIAGAGGGVFLSLAAWVLFGGWEPPFLLPSVAAGAVLTPTLVAARREAAGARRHRLASPGAPMPEGPPDAWDAMWAVLRCGRRLSGLRPDPEGALEIIRPYADCEAYAAGERFGPKNVDRRLRIVRSLVCANVADCHRELGDVRTAAEWYRRAGQSLKEGGCPALYADMALRHELDDHYEVALDYLRHSLAVWQAKPLLVRLFWHVVSGWWLHPWDYRSLWRTIFRQRALVAELEARVAERAGQEERGRDSARIDAIAEPPYVPNNLNKNSEGGDV